MAVVKRSDIAKALQPGINKWWGMSYQQLPLQLEKIFDTFKSSKSYEEDQQLVGTGLFPVKPEGSATAYDKVSQGRNYKYNHLTYSMGVMFTHEMLMDKQYDLGLKKVKFLADSARRTQETVAANILNRAFNSAYTYADGIELIATNHPLVGGGTQSNELATPADLSHAALEQALIDIGNFVDDRGQKMAHRATKLIIPPSLEYEARRILESSLQSGTDFNDINTLKDSGLQIVVANYLTDTDAWFLKTDVSDGLKRFVREPVSAPKRETDFDTDNIKFKVMFRESYGATDFRGIYGSPGA